MLSLAAVAEDMMLKAGKPEANARGSAAEGPHHKRRPRRRSLRIDDSCTRIDHAEFFFVKIFRMRVEELLHKPSPNEVHFVGVAPGDVPLHVKNFLGKSIKLIPQPELKLTNLTDKIFQTLRSCAWALRLQQRPGEGNGDFQRRTSTSDGRMPRLVGADAQALIQAAHFVWQGAYGLLDSAALAADPPRSNLSRLDVKSMQWLRANSSSHLAVETDKDLGIAVCSSGWVREHIRKHLHSSYIEVDTDEVSDILRKLKIGLDLIVEGALRRGVIRGGQAKFLRSNLTSLVIPLFRINAKIHKSPIESRPISNLRGFVLGPASNFLNAALLPSQKQ